MDAVRALLNLKRWEEIMGRWPKLIGLAVLLCAVLSCTSLELRKARIGVDAAVAQLPVLQGFDVIEILNLDRSISAFGETCYYARAYVIIGSSLSETEALSGYSKALQSVGWVPDLEPYAPTWGLIRGSSEYAVIEVGEPYVGFKEKDPVNWAQWEAKYRTIMNIRIDYMLPQRDGC